MRSGRGSARGVARGLLFVTALLAGTAGTPLQAQDDDDTDLEEFEEEDPYTKGDPERLAKLGYENFGPFSWVGGEFTNHVQETMGGVPVLWVETAHFKLGSALGTYRLPLDREDRERIEGELKRLKKRLGRGRMPKKELDPWLRLHIYAQRLEELYAEFCRRFELSDADFPAEAPYLGQTDKFLVLLCQTRSSLGRVLQRYVGVEQDYSYRYGFPDGGFLFAASAEALASGGWSLDSAIHCAVVSGVVENFVDAYRANNFGAPVWLRYGLAHWFSREIDPRWTPAIGLEEGRYRDEDDAEWRPRVMNLVKNDFFASAPEMFGWREYADLDVRDHMIVWSKVDFLFELGGDGPGRFLEAVCKPKPEGAEEEITAQLVARQVEALDACFGLSLEGLDEDWAQYVKRRYR